MSAPPVTVRMTLAGLVARYRPRPLPAWSGTAISVITAFTATSRGLDIITGSPLAGPVNAAVDILGSEFWGIALLVAGLGIYAGLASRRLGPLLFAHTWGAGVYVGYAIALTQGVLDDPAPGGWRFVSTAIGGAAFHLLRVTLLTFEVRQIGREG